MTSRQSVAELSVAELSVAELSAAELSAVELSVAELSVAELSVAELSVAELCVAELSQICHFSPSAGPVSIRSHFLWPKPTKSNNMESNRDFMETIPFVSHAQSTEK
jgi:hypothetical protein